MKEERKKETSFLLGSLSRSWKKVDKETACVCEQGHPGVCGSCGTDYFAWLEEGRQERVDAWPTLVAQAQWSVVTTNSTEPSIPASL